MKRLTTDAGGSPTWLEVATHVAAWFPAVFWVTYSISNTLLDTPPGIGRLTVINVIYILMLPGVVAVTFRRPRVQVPGQWLYVAFMGWVVLGLLWYNPSRAMEAPKRILIYGLLAFGAAQVLVAARAPRALALKAFVGAVMLTAAMLSLWTVQSAVETGFSYRAGISINPNFVAIMIAPATLVGLVLYVSRMRAHWRICLLAAVLSSFYAVLLLGSRGVLLALLAGGVVVVSRLGRELRRSRALPAGAVLIILFAQVPAVPDTIVRKTRDLVQSVRQAKRIPDQPIASGHGNATQSPDPSSRAEVERAAAKPEETVRAPLVARGTALARFGEAQTDSLNLRLPLWRACIAYLSTGARPLLFGGGMGMSEALANRANRVFANAHSAFLQIAVDFGLVGTVLFALFHWRIGRALAVRNGGPATAALAGVVFWLVAGLTATVTDLHVYWMSLGMAGAIAASCSSSSAGRIGRNEA